MPTLAFKKVGSCVIYVSGRQAPSDTDWNTYIESLKSSIVPGVPPKVLVISDVVPNSAQRAKLNELVSKHSTGLKVSVVTGSAIGRGVTTALGWFARDSYRAFSPAELDAAIEYLETNPAARIAIKSAVESLRATLT